MRYEGVPGLVETQEAYGETTLVVDPARLIEACRYLRDDQGFPLPRRHHADRLPGLERTADRRIHRHRLGPRPERARLGRPRSESRAPKPKRFAMNYHLLRAGSAGAPRVRVQVWLDEGEPVESVVSIWPTADWHEREAWDMMGIRIEGHPNLRRILMEDDWEGHPLRKDYPLGGEPVRFSGEE